MSKNLGKGDKYSAGEPLSDGLSERESINEKAKLRGETGESTQRPTGKTESVSSDRGTFKNKC